MLKIDIIKPIDDNKMTYDYNTHRYILNLAVVNELDGRYKDETIAKRRLKSISSAIYNYIYEHSNSHNKAFLEFYLNCTHYGRDIVFNAMYHQLLADLENGYENIGIQNNIDYSSGSIISREQQKENRICLDSEIELQSATTPINVLYAGVFPQASKYACMQDRYEKYGY